MASGIYDKARQSFLSQSPSIDWDSDTIKATLIYTTNYAVNLSTHQYMNTNTVPANAKVGSPVTLASKTVTSGVADAADPVFTSVSGSVASAIIIWKDGGDGGTTSAGTNDLLISYHELQAPVTPVGGDITIVLPNGTNKLFKL